MLDIYIDADACPVKEETIKVAFRYQLNIVIVANQYQKVPQHEKISFQLVSGGFDAADDWIVEKIEEGDILITSDLLLADRCIKKNARVLGPKGRELDENNIGEVLASREINEHLRHLGTTGTGPKPMQKQDKSNFLNKLDQIINAQIKQYRK